MTQADVKKFLLLHLFIPYYFPHFLLKHRLIYFRVVVQQNATVLNVRVSVTRLGRRGIQESEGKVEINEES